MHVVIAGSGIAGLALARALGDRGHDVTVLEKTEAPKDIGGGILVPPNSMRILQQLGVADRIAVSGCTPETRDVRRWEDGSLIAGATLGAEVRRVYGAPYVTMHRADLHSALLAAAQESTGDSVDIRFGSSVVDSRTDGDKAVAVLSDGTEVIGDVVVGGDGLHSRVRRSIGLLDEPTFEGNILWWSLVPMDQVLLDSRNEWVANTLAVVIGPERHVVHFPVRGGNFVMLAAIVPWTEAMPEDWTAVGDRDAAVEPFASWSPDLRRLMDLATVVHPWPLLDRDPFDYWSQGRVALVGDAAHPMLPHQAQGAAQSVEDAWVLAKYLDAGSASDVPTALTSYQRGRLPRATFVQQASRDHGAAYHLPDGPAQQDRDRVMAAQAGNAAVSFDWLWGSDPESTPPA